MPYASPDEQRRYQREWLARRRNDWVAANGPCTDCGSCDELQVDHVDASMKVSHRIWSWSATRREVELAKCVVRCKACHIAKTMRNQEFTTHQVGEMNGHAKLTAADIPVIRASQLTTTALARQYNVNSGTISLIRRHLTWQHVA
jgi:hypothetical protein